MKRALRGEERRNFGRIHFDPALVARLGEARVSILDLSLSGARVASETRFSPNTRLELNFQTDRGPVSATCDVVRCTLAQFAKAPGEKSIYQTGLRVCALDDASNRAVRETIATRVMQALEEQKANAHGIPPPESIIAVAKKSDRYRRCDFLDGRWRRIETADPTQPPSGFTVAAEVAMQHVEMLCETYERGNEQTRQLTKTLAQLSVTTGEGVPARRYIP